MEYVIVGSGFTGLVAALDLAKKGNKVTILEKNPYIGGLAAGFSDLKWSWPLEHHYHHIFKSDKSIIDLANELGVAVNFRRVKTGFWNGEKVFQFDSLISVLVNKEISWLDKIRTLMAIGILKITPSWRFFEKTTSEKWIKATMGHKVWTKIWEPLFRGKFHNWASSVNGTWFWARIHARSQALGYFDGGFSNLITTLEKKLEELGVEIHLNIEVQKIQVIQKKVVIKTNSRKFETDKVLITGPRSVVTYVLPGTELTGAKVPGLGAITMILAMKHSLLKDNTYWLNVSDPETPFLAVVEHTNMIDKKNYDGDCILYLGNYLPKEHDFFTISDQQLFNIYAPYLKKINNQFDPKWVRKIWTYKASYAQSVFGIDHGQNLPEMEIVKGKVYWCGIEHVYPWDRGTNYAVAWGHRVAKIMLSKVR